MVFVKNKFNTQLPIYRMSVANAKIRKWKMDKHSMKSLIYPK